MKELIFSFVHQYALWGILLVAFVSMIILHCMYRQIRKMNRQLGMVTGKVQEYFDVIMAEEDTEPSKPQGAAASVEERRYRDQDRRTRREDTERPRRQRWPSEEDFELTQREREMLLSTPKGSRKDEEALDAVLQEYFS